jgi:hypothetical protein
VGLPPHTSHPSLAVPPDCLDREGTVVARATVRWRVGPVR